MAREAHESPSDPLPPPPPPPGGGPVLGTAVAEVGARATEHLETEVKLGASVDFVVPDLSESFPDLVLTAAPTLALEAVYFDTADLALTRSKVSLRHRTGEGAARWTLKLPKDKSGPVDPDAVVAGTLRRRELNIMSDDGSAVPSVLASLVIGWTRGDPLAPIVTLRTERRRVLLQDRASGAEMGEIDDDTVQVLHGDVLTETFREIEVEVDEQATNDVLPTVAAALRFAGATEADSTSKVGRALGPAGAVPAVPLGVVVDRDADVEALVRSALSRSTAVLIGVDHAIRLDDDPGAVRRASAAVRRLRADLRLLRPNLEAAAVAHLREELAWLQAQLGRVRQLDVIGDRVRAGLARLDPEDRGEGATLLDHLAAVRAMTRTALVTSMCTPRYVALLRSLVAMSAAPPLQAGLGDLPATRVARRIARRPVQRIGREIASLEARSDHPTDEQIRGLRRRVRNARLGIQLVDPLLRRSGRLVRSLAEAQDELGVLADATDTEEWLRATATVFASPSLSFVAGQLAAGERADAAAVRSEWRLIVGGITHPADQFLRR